MRFTFRDIFSLRFLRWLLLALVGSVSIALVVVATYNQRTDPVSLPTDGSLMSIQRFTTVLQQEEMRLRISGDVLTIAPLKLIGPFRLGLVHTLTVHNGTIETFPDEQSQSQSGTSSTMMRLDRFLASLPSTLDRFVASAVLEQSPMTIAQVTGAPFTLIQHHGDRDEVIFTATSCRTTMRNTKAVCQDGTIGSQGQTVSFRELSYDGRTWKLQATSGEKREVATWAELF